MGERRAGGGLEDVMERGGGEKGGRRGRGRENVGCR